MSTQLETEILKDEEIDRELKALRGWGRDEAAIRKTYQRGSFREALALVNKIGDLAEQLNHHPDILIEYSNVTLRIWTHKANAITRADINLAREIEKMAG